MSSMEVTAQGYSLPLNDPSQWPLRMTRDEVLHVIRRKGAWLRLRMKQGRFPRPDSDFMWSREDIRKYAQGGIRQFDAMAARTAKTHRGKRSHPAQQKSTRRG